MGKPTAEQIRRWRERDRYEQDKANRIYADADIFAGALLFAEGATPNERNVGLNLMKKGALARSKAIRDASRRAKKEATT